MSTPAMAAMRSMRNDPSVATRKLPPGTVRRVVSFARPYRRDLTFFLLLVTGSSVIGVVTPLLAGDIVNRIATLEGTFVEPDFHRKNGDRTEELKAELSAEKERLHRLYARWEELEQIKALSARPISV